MGAKSVPLSVRLSQKDAEYIAGLQTGDAVTMSEKVRHLVADARRLSQEGKSFDGVVKHTAEVLAPLGKHLDHLEDEAGKSSQLLRTYLQWLPGMLATLERVEFDQGGTVEGSLCTLEAKAAERTQDLLDQLARLAVTKEAPCLDKTVMRRTLAPLTELIELQLKNN